MEALKNKGNTIAVIGTGLDVYYPKENKALQDYMAKNHLVLTEYGPGEQPLKYHYPERNRIISGLCQGLWCLKPSFAREVLLLVSVQWKKEEMFSPYQEIF